MKYILYLLFFLPFFSNAQVVEEIRNEKGEIVSVSKTKSKSDLKTPEKIVNLFYANQNDINAIDKLISTRLYQKTPYVKFKEVLNKKNNIVGNYKSKKIIEVIKSNDSFKSVTNKSKVEYQNKNTIEEIVLIQESANREYQIFNYNIKIVE